MVKSAPDDRDNAADAVAATYNDANDAASDYAHDDDDGENKAMLLLITLLMIMT